jgi:alpha-L-fucosidase 2
VANLTRRGFLGTFPAASAAARQTGNAARDGGNVLWYRQPAGTWTDALPVGNGRLGAMVFGGVGAERLQLNEDTLWSGNPREWNNPGAKDRLVEVRRLVMEQEDYLAADKVCTRMQGPYNESYLPLADLTLEFAGVAAASGYRRELNLDTAVSRVSYRSEGAGFTREVFASAPDQVVVVRITCSRPGRLDFAVSLNSPLLSTTLAQGKDSLCLRGKAPAHVDPDYLKSEKPVVYDVAEGKGMRFEAQVRVLAEGGEVKLEGNQVRVTGAESAMLLISAATGYRGYDRAPDKSAAEISALCTQHLDAAANRTFAELRSRHIADHRKLFRRVSRERPYRVGYLGCPGSPGCALVTKCSLFLRGSIIDTGVLRRYIWKIIHREEAAQMRARSMIMAEMPVKNVMGYICARGMRPPSMEGVL